MIKDQKPEKILYIIAGPPGSGKTTFAKQLASRKQIDLMFEADMWMADNEGLYQFNSSKLFDCHKKCQQNVKLAMAKGLPVIVSNTSLTKSEAQPYVNLAKQFCYGVKIYHMEGNYQNVHGVPEEKVQKMRKKHQKYKIEDFKN